MQVPCFFTPQVSLFVSRASDAVRVGPSWTPIRLYLSFEGHLHHHQWSRHRHRSGERHLPSHHSRAGVAGGYAPRTDGPWGVRSVYVCCHSRPFCVPFAGFVLPLNSLVVVNGTSGVPSTLRHCGAEQTAATKESSMTLRLAMVPENLCSICSGHI